jgi:Flp pilus assembly protein TadG
MFGGRAVFFARRWSVRFGGGKSRRGVVAVEFALVLPILTTLVLGMWELGRFIEVQQILQNAAGVGGRQASTGSLTNYQVQQAVIDCLAAAGLPTANVNVDVRNLAAPETDVSQAGYLDRLQVVVTIPYSDVRWISGMFVSPSAQLRALAVWYSTKAQAYPTGIGVPPGF